MSVLAPELLYREGGFERDYALELSRDRIGRIEPAAVFAAEGVPIERLPGRALLPGFVNAHSHAFQRVIRGRTQWRPADRPADFWSWREAMYGAALGLSADDILAVSRFCFLEMLLAGYTSVGEFHYLHRAEAGNRYPDGLELAHRVIAAADDVGIRIALLHVCYATGNVGQALSSDQRRFATSSLADYLADVDTLIEHYHGRDLVSVGIAPHSVRAVPRDWLGRLHAAATERDLPFHIHASEQPAEVAAAEAEYGLRPVDLLHADGALDGRTCLVHATHITDEEIALIAESGARVCACPTTERDLGDGFLRGHELVDSGVTVAIGSDSQTVIDPLEEIRLIEYHERLRRLQRVVIGCVRGEPARIEPAPVLLDIATAGGAAALRLDAGRIRSGALADLIAVDLDSPSLAGWSETTLASLLALSAPAAVVADAWVGGVRRVSGGSHALAAEAASAYRDAAKRVAESSGMG